MNYVHQGDPLASRSMDVELTAINEIDEDGLWVTVFDEEGMECELIIRCLTPERMKAFMEKWSI